jgi:hypothetical protein
MQDVLSEIGPGPVLFLASNSSCVMPSGEPRQPVAASGVSTEQWTYLAKVPGCCAAFRGKFASVVFAGAS